MVELIRFKIIFKPGIIYGFLTLFLFFISCYYFYPGWLSPDSVSQYEQAVSGNYNSWHPVLMAWWWRILNQIHPGPGGFLIQNLLFYWVGIYLIAITLFKYFKWWSLFTLIVALTPPALFVMGQIWKDGVFTSAMILSLGIAFNSISNKIFTFKRFFLLLLLIAFAFGCKPNGILPGLIIIIWWIIKNNEINHKLAALIGSLILVIGLPSVIVANLNVVKISPIQYIQSHDLLAIGVRNSRVLLPEYIVSKSKITVENSKQLYSPSSNNYLFYGTQYGSLASIDKDEISSLNKIWYQAITDYPVSYFLHRLDVFKKLLRIEPLRPTWVATDVSVKNKWGFTFTKNKFSDFMFQSVILYPYIFLPWVYFLASIFCLFFTLRLKGTLREFGLVIGFSNFLFLMPHFFIAPAADYRYIHFSIVCSIIQISIMASYFTETLTTSIYKDKVLND